MSIKLGVFFAWLWLHGIVNCGRIRNGKSKITFRFFNADNQGKMREIALLLKSGLHDRPRKKVFFLFVGDEACKRTLGADPQFSGYFFLTTQMILDPLQPLLQWMGKQTIRHWAAISIAELIRQEVIEDCCRKCAPMIDASGNELQSDRLRRLGWVHKDPEYYTAIHWFDDLRRRSPRLEQPVDGEAKHLYHHGVGRSTTSYQPRAEKAQAVTA